MKKYLFLSLTVFFWETSTADARYIVIDGSGIWDTTQFQIDVSGGVGKGGRLIMTGAILGEIKVYRMSVICEGPESTEDIFPKAQDSIVTALNEENRVNFVEIMVGSGYTSCLQIDQ